MPKKKRVRIIAPAVQEDSTPENSDQKKTKPTKRIWKRPGKTK